MSPQSTSLEIKSVSVMPRLAAIPPKILFSTEGDGYSCSKVTGNLSRNASFNTLVPINLPSSDPFPLVLAVAIILNQFVG